MDNDRGLKLLITALPLLTAWLYAIGVSHHQGFLSAYGAHYSLFGLDFESALLNGFIALFTWSFPAVLYAVLLLFAFVFTMAIIAAISLNKRPRVFFRKIRRRLRAMKPRKRMEPTIEKALEGALTINSFLGGFVMVLILFGVSILLGLESGKSYAHNAMKEYSSDSAIGLSIDGARSQIVRCNDDFCLIWDGEASKQIPRARLNSIAMPVVPANGA